MTVSDFCDLQSFIKAHFTLKWLADPVDEGIWFLCGLSTAAVYLQFHHFTLIILGNNDATWYVKYCLTKRIETHRGKLTPLRTYEPKTTYYTLGKLQLLFCCVYHTHPRQKLNKL